jgi:perosamine synthetase
VTQKFTVGVGRPLTYGRQHLDADDKRAVAEVLAGDWLTQGPAVERFEGALAEYFGTRHAVVCCNGTAALHLAALCLGWGPGDVVLMPAISFLASANCCEYVGAEPFFVDIDPESLTIDVNDVERHVRALRSQGRRVRAVVGVDFAGHACDWAALRGLADRFDLELVDDACHAMGGRYADDVKVGSCTHNDLTTLSFHPVKHITSGEGGALLTNDAGVAEHARRLRSHGTVREPDATAGWDGPWVSDMIELGYNFRLSDLHAALGLSQLAKLDRFVTGRREIAQHYAECLPTCSAVRVPDERPGVEHAYHLFIGRADFTEAGLTKRDLFRRCAEQGIRLQVHYRPVVENSYYRDKPLHHGAAERLRVSYAFYEQAFSLPIHPGLTEQDLDHVGSTLAHLLPRATT